MSKKNAEGERREEREGSEPGGGRLEDDVDSFENGRDNGKRVLFRYCLAQSGETQLLTVRSSQQKIDGLDRGGEALNDGR